MTLYDLWFFRLLKRPQLFCLIFFFSILIYLIWSKRANQSPLNESSCIHFKQIVGVGCFFGCLGLFFSLPYLIFENSGNSDDWWFMVSTWLNKHQSLNSTFLPYMCCGVDARLTPAHTWPNLLNLYQFFPPRIIFGVVITLNVLISGYFSWRVLCNPLKVHPFFALGVSMAISVTQGLWAGKFGDSHLTYLHGQAFVPFFIFLLEKFSDSRPFWFKFLSIGFLYQLVSTFWILQAPTTFLTLVLWSIFVKNDRSKKFWLGSLAFFVPILLCNLSYLKAIQDWSFDSARFSSVQSVALPGWSIERAIYSMALAFVILLCVNNSVKSTARHSTLRIAALFCFCMTIIPSVALIAHDIIPISYRWETLYTGNHFLKWASGVALINGLVKVARPYLSKFFCVLCIMLCLLFFVFSFNWSQNALKADIGFTKMRNSFSQLHQDSDIPVPQSLRSDHAPFRILPVGSDPDIHFGWMNGFENVAGYFSLINSRVVNFWNHIDSQGGNARYLVVTKPVLTENGFNALRLLNVRYILSNSQLVSPELTLISKKKIPLVNLGAFSDKPFSSVLHLNDSFDGSKSWLVYEITNWLPRAHFARGLIALSEKRNLTSNELEYAASGMAFFHNKIKIEVPTTLPLAEASLELQDYSPGYLKYLSSSASWQFCIVSQPMNRFCRAHCDGKATPLFVVNDVQIGCFVSSGRHELEFFFSP